MTSPAAHRYNLPAKPTPIRVFNAAATPIAKRAAPYLLKPEHLLAAAKRQVPAADFDELFFGEPLERLTQSILTEARLTPLGLTIQRFRLVGALANRLRLDALCRQHPEILATPLPPLLVIAGLQRTGTTMLHRLLASLPDVRAILSWEALNPVPFAGERGDEQRRRIKQAERAEAGLRYLAPEFFAIHPIETHAPEEDILLLDLSFMTQTPEATMHVPSYAAWLEAQDHRPAYAYLRKTLQALQWLRPGKYMVLKTPHHMEYLDVLLSTFPQAMVVQTHRDPRKTMASFCSMVAHGRAVFSNHVDPLEVGRHWLRKVDRMISRSIAARQATANQARCVDVLYAELIRDPEWQIQGILERFGLPWQNQFSQVLRQTRSQNSQHKYGKHSYKLDDFGLCQQQVADRFAAYCRLYNIPKE